MTTRPLKTDGWVPKPRTYVPETTFPVGHRWAGKRRCLAWSRRNGRQCNRIPMRNKTVCRSHGGAGGRPAKHGRYSIPAKIADAAIRALGDPRLLHSKEHIAILDARTRELLVRLPEEGIGVAEKEVSKGLDLVKKGVALGRMDCCRKGADRIERALASISLEANTWHEVRENFRLRDALVRTEQKWEIDAGLRVPVAEVLEVLRVMIVQVHRHIPDPAARHEFVEEVRKFYPQV
jgi:hypothetical protein